jgi:DNA-directed RNA polymerase II subunit RPB1
MPDEDIDPDKISPWLLCIELDREMMIDKKLRMVDIAEKSLMRMMSSSKIEGNKLTEMARRGILDINKVFIKHGKVNKFDQNEGFKAGNEWRLDKEGVNLLVVMCHEDVDATRTSNHLIKVIEVLGIEVVRRSLLDELQVVISFNGSYVNYRHLTILCNTMTYKGHLMAIIRHNINRNDIGALLRCSFQETVDILLDDVVYVELTSWKVSLRTLCLDSLLQLVLEAVRYI